MSGPKKDLDMILVQSKIRELVRDMVVKFEDGQKDLRTSDEFIAALNAHVHQTLQNAASRAVRNGRQTLRAQDV